MTQGISLIAAEGRQSAPGPVGVDHLPLPVAVEFLTAQKRDQERAQSVGGKLSLLVPLTLALARLNAQCDATARNNDD